MKQSANTDLRVRLVKGTGAQGFSQAVLILIRLAEVPLLLGFWGTQLYGEWLMVAAIPAYLSMGDGGFSTAACREMTMRNGAGDRDGTLAVFQSTWVLLILLSITVGFFAAMFVNVAPIKEWLGFSAMNERQAKIVLLLLVAHVLVGFQGGLINGGFWVSGRYPFGMSLQAVTQLLEFAGLAAAVALGGGPVHAASGYLCGRVLGTGLMLLGQRRVSPWLGHGFSHASFAELRRLTAPAFASLAFPLGNAMNIQGMRLVIGLALGPPAVAVFVPLRTLSRLAMQPSAVINRLMQPELALAFGAEDSALFKKLFAKSCQVALWGCLTACLLLAPAAKWIFPTWTGGKVLMHWPAYIILLAGVLMNSIWYTALMVPYATNRHGRIAMFYTLVYGAAAFGLGYLGAAWLGLGGVAMALLIAETTMGVIVVRTSLRMTEMAMSQWVRNMLRPPLDILWQATEAFRKYLSATA